MGNTSRWATLHDGQHVDDGQYSTMDSARRWATNFTMGRAAWWALLRDGAALDDGKHLRWATRSRWGMLYDFQHLTMCKTRRWGNT